MDSIAIFTGVFPTMANTRAPNVPPNLGTLGPGTIT